jgi:localization factor PodJL
MTTNPPWRVKGVDKGAREAARSAAMREGTSLGAWLTRALLAAAGNDAKGAPSAAAGGDPVIEAIAALSTKLDRTQATLDRVSRRLAALETGAARETPPATPPRRAAPAVAAALVAALLVAALAALWIGAGDGGRQSEPETAAGMDGEPGDGAERPPQPAATEPEPDLASPETPAAEGDDLAATVAGSGAGPGSGEAVAGLGDSAAPPPPAPRSAALGAEAKTFGLTRESARQGLPDAQYNLGLLYLSGSGTGQDHAQAALWFERAARQGLASAQYNLALMYERGTGIAPDPGRARTWYASAAEQGHARAQHNLGVMYARGIGVAPDPTAAAGWFAKAAEQGHANAQFNLATLYERGLGVERDHRLAFQWFSLAAAADDPEATARRDRLAAKLTPEEMAEARAALAAWPGAAAAPTPEMVTKVQSLLGALGFDPGPADGALRHQTAQAIRSYQAKLGLEVDGRVSEELLGHLEKVTGGG